jgi:hypothetical protein
LCCCRCTSVVDVVVVAVASSEGRDRSDILELLTSYSYRILVVPPVLPTVHLRLLFVLLLLLLPFSVNETVGEEDTQALQDSGTRNKINRQRYVIIASFIRVCLCVVGWFTKNSTKVWDSMYCRKMGGVCCLVLVACGWCEVSFIVTPHTAPSSPNRDMGDSFCGSHKRARKRKRKNPTTHTHSTFSKPRCPILLVYWLSFFLLDAPKDSGSLYRIHNSKPWLVTGTATVPPGVYSLR